MHGRVYARVSGANHGRGGTQGHGHGDTTTPLIT
ncbi:hypothetical protein GGQ08_001594 [Salinibacter ruber]|nr:hypothetical protein [Salinibacter ruber]MCS3653554.1 hypothetical protein [Salinibacter ruber]